MQSMEKHQSIVREHLLVRASAGSGKTYQLIRRLISLLADGKEPGSILAITFSRKSAGEFRRKLFETLGEAAGDEQAAATLARDISHPEWTSSDFRTLLKSQVRKPDKLRLSTIDAFFYEIIGMYRLELGIGPEIFIQDENLTEFARLNMLRKMVQDRKEKERNDLLYLIQQTSWGSTANEFKREFENWLQNTIVLLRQAPDAVTWGGLPVDIQLKLPSGNHWKSEVARFEKLLPTDDMDADTRLFVERVIEQLYEWEFEPVLAEPATKWIADGIEQRDKLLAGKKYFIPRKKRVPITSEAGASLVQLSIWFYSYKLKVAVDNTKVAHAFARTYENFYEQTFLRKGTIQFSDFPYLLEKLETLEGGKLAYRLDAQIKHWLLDEFQDTSRAQWQVIQPLVDELFYDRDGDRSFYCVGDRKQAIYAWREGDSRLFDLVWEKYSPFEPRPLQKLDLAKTYRCPPVVVRLVNALLGDKKHFPEKLSSEAVENWTGEWIAHESAQTKESEGHVVIRVSEEGEGKDRLLIRNLKSDEPWKHGSCAVLCRTNSEAHRLNLLLREANIPTARDGALSLVDDFFLGRMIRALLSWMAHPDDRISHYCLQNSPVLRLILRAFKIEGLDHLRVIHKRISLCPDVLRERWHLWGETKLLAELEKEMKLAGYWSESEERCQRTLVHFFHKARKKGLASMGELVKELENYRMESPADERCVQLMTIHRAKGLEYRTVILPELDSFARAPGNITGEMWKIEDNEHKIESILEGPSNAICQTFPELEEWRHRLVVEMDYEKICLFYVGLTRTSHSLWMYLDQRKTKSPMKDWIVSALNLEEEMDLTEEETLYETGTCTLPAGQEQEPGSKIEPMPPARKDGFSFLTTGQDDLHVIKQRPSWGSKPTGEKFHWKKRQTSLQFGRKVHEVLASMDWPLEEWSKETDLDPQIKAYLDNAFTYESIHEMLKKPREETLLWKEKAFDVCINKTWMSGIFDRVQLPQNWKEAHHTKIKIIDFKTDRSDDTSSKSANREQSYRSQLETYRHCLSRILDVPGTRIECVLIYLGSGATQVF